MAFSMSFSVSDEMNLFSQEFQNYLSPSSLQQLAKEVGFVQRTTKYQAQELIALCVWFSQQSRVTPLTQLCSRLEASTGVLMSPEGWGVPPRLVGKARENDKTTFGSTGLLTIQPKGLYIRNLGYFYLHAYRK